MAKCAPAKILELDYDGGRYFYSFFHDGEKITAERRLYTGRIVQTFGPYDTLTEAVSKTADCLQHLIQAAALKWTQENKSPEFLRLCDVVPPEIRLFV